MRRAFHYLCALLLLIAQQGALAHAVWHSTQRVANVAQSYTPQQTPADPHGANSLCALDAVYVQVLGGTHGAAPPQHADVPSAILAAQNFNDRLSAEAITAHSRGPPSRL